MPNDKQAQIRTKRTKKKLAYFNLSFLSNIWPILSSNTRFPIKVNWERHHRLVISCPKTSHIIASLRCSKCKGTRTHSIAIVIIVAMGWCNLYLHTSKTTSIPHTWTGNNTKNDNHNKQFEKLAEWQNRIDKDPLNSSFVFATSH